MDLDRCDKMIKRAYEPYRKEALYSFFIQIVGSICVICSFLCVDEILSSKLSVFLLPTVLALYTLLSVIFIYNLSIISIFEFKKNALYAKKLQLNQL